MKINIAISIQFKEGFRVIKLSKSAINLIKADDLKAGDFLAIEGYTLFLKGGKKAGGSSLPEELNELKFQKSIILRICNNKIKVFACSPSGMYSKTFVVPSYKRLNDIIYDIISVLQNGIKEI